MNVINWLDSISLERPDLKLCIEAIKTKLETGKNIETVVDDSFSELEKIETELKKQFN